MDFSIFLHGKFSGTFKNDDILQPEIDYSMPKCAQDGIVLATLDRLLTEQ